MTSTGAGTTASTEAAPPWTVSNSGNVSSGSADGFNLSGGATLTNNAGGVITSTGTLGGGLGVGAALYINSGTGNVTNNGSISGGGYGVGARGRRLGHQHELDHGRRGRRQDQRRRGNDFEFRHPHGHIR